MPTYPVINKKTKETKTLSMTMKEYCDWKDENPDWDKDCHKVVQESIQSLDGQEKQSPVVGTKFWTVHPNNRVPRFGKIVTTPSNSKLSLCPQKESLKHQLSHSGCPTST